jgi:hypothetical protein
MLSCITGNYPQPRNHYMKKSVVAAFILLTGWFTPVYADDCTSVVVDDAKVFSDIKKVENAALSFQNRGPTVRIHTVAGGSDVMAYTDSLRIKCNWGRGQNDYNSNMLVIVYAPDAKPDFAIRYGSFFAAKLGNDKWKTIMSRDMTPGVRAWKAGERDGMDRGFSLTLAEFEAEWVKSAAQSAAPSTVNITQASDHSGFVKFLFALLLFGAAGAGIFWWTRRKKDDQELNSAKELANNARSIAVQGINEITDTTNRALLDAKVLVADATKQAALKIMYDEYVQLGDDANDALNRFDTRDALDRNLSVSAYAAKQRRYEEIVRSNIEPAKKIAANIKAGKIPTQPKAYTGPAPRAPYAPRTPRAPTPPTAPASASEPSVVHHHHTTYVDRGSNGNDMITGVLIGESLDRSNQSNYVEPYHPSRRRDDDDDSRSSHSSRSSDSGSGWGSSSSSSSSSDSGSSYSSSSDSSSYDSGSSYSSSSDSGGSFSSSDN